MLLKVIDILLLKIRRYEESCFGNKKINTMFTCYNESIIALLTYVGFNGSCKTNTTLYLLPQELWLSFVHFEWLDMKASGRSPTFLETEEMNHVIVLVDFNNAMKGLLNNPINCYKKIKHKIRTCVSCCDKALCNLVSLSSAVCFLTSCSKKK